MSASPFSFGTKILGGAAAVLTLLLLVGYLLPADWEAEAELVSDLPADALFRYLDSPEGWRDWTAWPESGVERSGPARGEGAAFSWDDPELGSGSFTISRAVAPERVEYQVVVGSSMYTEGDLTLSAVPGGTRIEWRERGDLGRNPLMGYWALSMDRAQSDELRKSLDRLAAAAAEGMVLADPAAADAHIH